MDWAINVQEDMSASTKGVRKSSQHLVLGDGMVALVVTVDVH